MSRTGLGKNGDDGLPSDDVPSSALVALVQHEGMPVGVTGDWSSIWRIILVISLMLLSSEVKRSSIDGIADVASDHIEALS